MPMKQTLIISISLILSAFIGGMFFYAAQADEHSIAVVGAATRRIDSDFVKWRVTLSRTADEKALANGYKAVRQDVEALIRQFAALNISDSSITIQPMQSDRVYGRDGQLPSFNIVQSLYVITSNVEGVEKLALNPASLLESGVILQSSYLEYFSSALATIKLELLSEATADARLRAEEIVRNSGASLGSLTSLRTGVFQINEPFSNEVSDYGMYNTQAKVKDITVTVRASFLLK